METKRQKGKLIIDDLSHIFIPARSIGPFVLNTNVSSHLDKDYYLEHYRGMGEELDYDSYYFHDFELYVYTSPDNLNINTIMTESSAYWNGRNLIGMKILDFIKTYPVTLDSVEKRLYVKRHNQYQTVYDFVDPDIQVWTWWGKIVTLIISSDEI